MKSKKPTVRGGEGRLQAYAAASSPRPHSAHEELHIYSKSHKKRLPEGFKARGRGTGSYLQF